MRVQEKNQKDSVEEMVLGKEPTDEEVSTDKILVPEVE